MSTPTPLERRRRVRRRWLVWATLPVWLGVFVLGLHLALMNVVAATARGQYADGQIGSAVVGFTWLKSTDPVERWKAPFDLGTTFTKGEDPLLGTFYLADALEIAPEDPETQCMVLINYAIALEMMGDQELADAQTRAEWAAEAQGYVDAGEAYPPGVPWGDLTPEEIRAEGREFAAWAQRDYDAATEARASCEPEGQSEEEQQQNSDSQERLEDKQQQAQDSEEQQQEEPQDGSEQAEEEKRQQELQERNEEAQAEAEHQRQEEQGDQGGSETKNW